MSDTLPAAAQFPDFPEMAELLKACSWLGNTGTMQVEGWVKKGERGFPLLSFHFGNQDPTAPVLVIVGGIHGLEKIGTQIITSFLQSWIRLLQWDQTLIQALASCRILFYPLANPVGMISNTRSNGDGIDLMRNAPIEAEDKVFPLVGGHRLSPHLPWYRGDDDNSMQPEAAILADFIRRHCFQSRQSLVLDVHSGFGWIDRLWFPFASTKKIFPDVGSMLALKKLFDRSYPHHVYKIEPQNHSYMTHGDLWDYLYLEQKKLPGDNVFIPLCLEMGSWHWIKKNPRQVFSVLGIFNPVLPHRLKRAERRHFLLFNFLVKAIVSGDSWAHPEPKRLEFLKAQAKSLWYE